ncbi:MAG: FtsQ-type POTRA domain-containing protein [Bacillota bacterium]
MNERGPFPTEGDIEGDIAEAASPRHAITGRLTAAALILLVLASAALTLLRSPYFHVENIEVHGIRDLTAQEIIVSCGLGRNENIFDVDLAMIASRIKANPKVDKVVVRRRLPCTIMVEIEERVPVAVLPYAGYYVQVDNTGLAVGLLEGYRDSRLPLVTGLAVQAVRVGHTVEAPELSLALGIAKSLPEKLLAQVSEINFDAARGFSLHMQYGTRVILGEGDLRQLASRIKVLEAILSRLEEEGRQATYIDVRFEKRPVVRDRR